MCPTLGFSTCRLEFDAKCVCVRKNEKPSRQIYVEMIDRTRAWTYFDGACQGDPLVCGVDGVIYLKK
jgi:hypothetical protein